MLYRVITVIVTAFLISFMARFPHVFSIAPGARFLPTLADAILDGRIFENRDISKHMLADITIYLPTRRAAHVLETLLAEKSGGQAFLMPKITPLGETDDAEFDLAANFPEEDAELVLAPSITPLERRLIFTQLIQKWAQTIDRTLVRAGGSPPLLIPDSPSDALSLAQDLEKLMDGFTVEDIPWDNIRGAVEADYSQYFLLTLDFVRIAHEVWPAILHDRQASDPAHRRNALLLAEAQRLKNQNPQTPIIAAGSTGSLPATAQLLAAISQLPNGAVILPGLDHNLDEASFDLLGAPSKEMDSTHGHPQMMLHRLITCYLGIKRQDIQPLGEETSKQQIRNRFISECLRPAETTDLWATFKPTERETLAQNATRDLVLIEARDEREEALTVAVALREAVQIPEHTALLVTPDRGLAERVRAELKRWDIDVEDSAGVPLSDTRPGLLARLICEASASNFSVRSVYALLHHPLFRCGLSRENLIGAIRAVELAVLRGVEPSPGLAGLRAAMLSRHKTISRRDPLPLRRLSDKEWEQGLELLSNLENAFQGFDLGKADTSVNLVTFAPFHRTVFEKLTQYPDEGFVVSFGVESDLHETEVLLTLLDDLSEMHSGVISGRPEDYTNLFFQLARQKTLFPARAATHRRVKIMGLLEARLMSADRIILGGLDETIWPPQTETDAFLNRPMRNAVGLSPPERRIGQTAHDFSQLAGHKHVIMTRAVKREGVPTIPSRFLQRIKAFGGEKNWNGMIARGERYIQWANRLEEREAQAPAQRPAPLSKPETFPLSLSVTEIETMIRDPYALFARHILKLDPLPALAEPPGAADRGTFFHEVLSQFAKDYPDDSPENAEKILETTGETYLQKYLADYPHLYADWRVRFQRVIRPYIRWEQERRDGLRKVYTERPGSWPLPLPDGRLFTLKGRADRIELKTDGTLAIIDFKTGQPPGIKEVLKGFSPQLTLEAMMLMEASFKDCPQAKTVPELTYVHLSGGRHPFQTRTIDTDRKEAGTLLDVVQRHRMILEKMVRAFASGQARYVSRPYAKYASRFSPYDHLARVREWSVGGTGEEQ